MFCFYAYSASVDYAQEYVDFIKQYHTDLPTTYPELTESERKQRIHELLVEADNAEKSKRRRGFRGRYGSRRSIAIAKLLGELRERGDHHYRVSERSLPYYTQAAELGHVGSQIILGKYFYSENDLITARKWYGKAALAGWPSAQVELGMMSLFGEGGEKDVMHAIKWFEKAAQKSDMIALYNLGMLYLRGLYVKKDLEKAHNFLKKAIIVSTSMKMDSAARRRLWYLKYDLQVEDDITTTALEFKQVPLKELLLRYNMPFEWLSPEHIMLYAAFLLIITLYFLVSRSEKRFT